MIGRIWPGLGRWRRTGGVDYDVTLAERTARPIAAIAASTTWAEYPQLWRALLDRVHAVVRTIGPDGRPGLNVMLYRDATGAGRVDVEVGVLLDDPTVPLTDGVVVSHLPAGTVASTVHRGGYERLGEAHRAILEWCAEHGRTPTGERWEIYGHWSDGPQQVTTEVCYALATSLPS
jgi:DNA gyrase inhibitor GyrI